MCHCLVGKVARPWSYRTIEHRLKKYIEKLLERAEHEKCLPEGKTVSMMSKLLKPGDKTIDQTKSKNVQVVTEAKADKEDKDSVDMAALVSSEENLRRLYACIHKWEDADKPQVFTVTLTIESDGKVGLVDIVPPRYKRGAFFKCVRKAFSQLNFGPSSRSSRTITIPFNFGD
jgi:sugar-specific transcriptional regulator TrmB